MTMTYVRSNGGKNMKNYNLKELENTNKAITYNRKEVNKIYELNKDYLKKMVREEIKKGNNKGDNFSNFAVETINKRFPNLNLKTTYKGTMIDNGKIAFTKKYTETSCIGEELGKSILMEMTDNKEIIETENENDEFEYTLP